jgi:hypothetical protein
MKKIGLATLTAILAAIGAPGAASARAVPASMGQAQFGTNANLINNNVLSGGVRAGGNFSWMLGLPIDSSGLHNVFLTAKAESPGASVSVRFSDAFGTVFGATASQPIPVSSNFVNLTFFNVNVVPGGVLFVHAQLNTNARILRADYTP